jgi:hypothetical protein
MWLVQRIAILELEKSSRDLIARVSKTNIYIYIFKRKSDIFPLIELSYFSYK